MMSPMAPRQNPFPGMNPYLERRWGDVHASLATYARDQLQEQLPTGLRARMQERVFIESAQEVLLNPRHAFSPDVHVFETAGVGGGGGGGIQAREAEGGGGTALEDEPLIISLTDIQVVESHVEIIDVGSGGRVVTTIEFISRSKRAGRGRREYLRKRRETIRAGASVVEVNLLRGGKPVTLGTLETVGERAWTPYHVSVLRATHPERIEYYRIPLRARLPVVKVPLRKKDPADVKLDLQLLVNEAYRKGRYDDIEYGRETLDPPLSAEDGGWVAQLLKLPNERP